MNYIRLRKNNLCVENISAQKLAKKYKTPFYCYSLAQIKNNYITFKNAFKSINPVVCFSVKSNSNLTILKELKKIGSGADVVSIGELLKAKKAGVKFLAYRCTLSSKEIKIEKKINILND